MKAIINAKILLEDTFVEGKVLLFDHQIVQIADDVEIKNVEIIDAEGAYVSAGFIDLHIHGNGGADVMDATPEALETISSTLLQKPLLASPARRPDPHPQGSHRRSPLRSRNGRRHWQARP